jgi:hypothetical protein
VLFIRDLAYGLFSAAQGNDLRHYRVPHGNPKAGRRAGLSKQFDFETPPAALNGESKFRLRGGRRRFALTPPEHFQL